MKRAMKIIAVVLAMLMLVGMATACANPNDDLNQSIAGNSGANNNGGTTNGGESNGNGSGTNDGNGVTNNGNGGGNGNAADTGNQDVIQNFNSTKKYDFKNNPLLAKGKKINTGIAPSFDIDTTGFVKNGIKIADLKGKTLTMITMLERANFAYIGPNGEKLNEWTWFDSMKKTYGLNFKYIQSRFDKANQQIITYMNSGKALDIIPSHRAAFPQTLLLSGPLDPYVNLTYVDNSPGIDKRTMDQMRWDDTYRCIAPIGAVDVLWYNATMAKELGLQDPYTLWKQDKWNWYTYQDFVAAAPNKAPNATNYSLSIGWCSEGDSVIFYPRTNGVNVFEIQTKGGKSSIVSNFEDKRCMEAWEFLTGVGKGRGSVYNRPSGDPQDDMYELGTTLMQGNTYLMRIYDYKFAKTQKYRWVPYPGKTADLCMCMNYGNTMMLPKKTKNVANIPYAVKFMELWANRFTEAMYDYLQQPYYNFTYEERIEFFDFAAKTNYFSVGTSIFTLLTGNDKEQYNKFTWSFYNPQYNVTTEATALANLVDKACTAIKDYGT